MSKYKLLRCSAQYDSFNRSQYRILKKGWVFYHDVGYVYAENQTKAETLAREQLAKPRFSEPDTHHFTL